MKLTVSLLYAQRAEAAISDDRYLSSLSKRVDTNIWEFDEGEDDEVDEIIDAICARLECVIPEGEYSIDYKQSNL